jgi:hypothetical protein
MQRFIFSIGLLCFFFICTSAICFKKEIPTIININTIKNTIQNDTVLQAKQIPQPYRESNARYAYNTILMAITVFLTYAVSVSAAMLIYPKLLNYILLCSSILLVSSIIDLVLHFSNKKKYPNIIFWNALIRLFIVVTGFLIWNKYR